MPGATYQRAIVVIFHDQMHKNMDAYVDDILVKSKEEEDHLDALSQVFERLILYKLRLNPQKCVFGVESGKLLGFIINKKGSRWIRLKQKPLLICRLQLISGNCEAFKGVFSLFADSSLI